MTEPGEKRPYASGSEVIFVDEAAIHDTLEDEHKKAVSLPASEELNNVGMADQISGSKAEEPPSKKRKIDSVAKQTEKVEKAREKERKKAEKDAEKEARRIEKDQAKREKDEAKRERDEARRKEREEKEGAKRLKEEAKSKQERAQRRLTMFVKAKSPESSLPDNRDVKTDYQSAFLPFAAGTSVRWNSPTTVSTTKLEKIQKCLTKAWKEHRPAQERSYTSRLAKPKQVKSARGLMEDLHAGKQVDLEAALADIPEKFIYFRKNLDHDLLPRPAYIGTYSKINHEQLRRAARNPFMKIRTDTDYGYESEYEWEEDEEGEDIGSDVESEADTDATGEEMDDFLDDEDDESRQALKPTTLTFEPICSGITWETANSQFENTLVRFEPMPPFDNIPISPFSAGYWAPCTPTGTADQDKPESQKKTTAVLLTGNNLAKLKTLVTDDSHRKLPKSALIEVLYNNDFDQKVKKIHLQNTLGAVAQRIKGTWKLVQE